jgi:hypothetical protein
MVHADQMVHSVQMFTSLVQLALLLQDLGPKLLDLALKPLFLQLGRPGFALARTVPLLLQLGGGQLGVVELASRPFELGQSALVRSSGFVCRLVGSTKRPHVLATAAGRFDLGLRMNPPFFHPRSNVST